MKEVNLTKLKIVLCILGIITLLTVLGTVLYLGYFGEYQKEYWDTYFDAKKKKINLADDAHIDSLLFEIQKRDSIIEIKNAIIENANTVRDSALFDMKLMYEKIIYNKDSIIKAITSDRDLLMDAIKHQNSMIQNLQK